MRPRSLSLSRQSLLQYSAAPLGSGHRRVHLTKTQLRAIYLRFVIRRPG